MTFLIARPRLQRQYKCEDETFSFKDICTCKSHFKLTAVNINKQTNWHFETLIKKKKIETVRQLFEKIKTSL